MQKQHISSIAGVFFLLSTCLLVLKRPLAVAQQTGQQQSGDQVKQDDDHVLSLDVLALLGTRTRTAPLRFTLRLSSWALVLSSLTMKVH